MHQWQTSVFLSLSMYSNSKRQNALNIVVRLVKFLEVIMFFMLYYGIKNLGVFEIAFYYVVNGIWSYKGIII